MSRHIITTRGVGRYAIVVALASLLLTGCGSGVAAASAVGQPSLSLTAPLTAVGCTTMGTCIALGASGRANGPGDAAQIRNHKGVWSVLKIPPAPSASFAAASCATSTCLFGGTKDSTDLLWSVNATTGAVIPTRGPSAGLVIRDLSCASNADCTAIDQAAHGLTRISHTINGGGHWSAPLTLAWALNTTTVLDCVSLTQCYVATTSAHHVVTVRETLNAGVTWRILATPATWTSLTSLDCDTTCTALVSTAAGSSVVTQSKATWSATALTFTGLSMSCITSGTCLVVGHQANLSAAMATWASGALSTVALTYVPSELTSVDCVPTICVALGVTTTVAIRP